MPDKKIFIVPANDLLRHPIPNRIYHIAKCLLKDYDIILFPYPNHPLSNGVLRTLLAEGILYKAFRVRDLSAYYILNAPYMLSAMEQVIKEADVVIHANVLPSLMVAKLAKKHGKTIIYDYLDHFPQSASAYYRSPSKKIVEKGVMFIILQVIKDSTAIVTPSFGLASFLRRYTEKPVYIIPNGVDSDLFKPMDMSFARKEIGIDFDGIILLLYGSIDVWLKIESVLHVVKRNREVRLLIVGYSHGKYYYRLLENLIRKLNIKDRIHKYPPQPYEKIPLFINASNAVVAPFTREVKNYTTPLKIVESLACARPVITTDISEFKLWFKKGLFYYKSPQNICGLLDRIIKDFDAIHGQLLGYSDIIRNKYSWKSIAEVYKRVIEDLQAC